MKIELTNDYILQLATAYAIHAVGECSENTKEYWMSVVSELRKKRSEDKKEN